MIKICHVIPFYGEQYGGSERYVETITSYQRSQGMDITILTTTKYRNKVGCETKNGIRIIRCFSYMNIWNINPISVVLPSLAKIDIDIIHIHSYLYFISNQAMIWATIKKIPVLLHLHGGIGQPPYQTTMLKKTVKSFYDKTIGKFMLKSADIVGSVSLIDIIKLKNNQSLPKDKLKYIPNVVHPFFQQSKFTKSKNKHNEIFKVLYIGDIEAWKGMNFLIKWLNCNGKNFNRKIKFQFIGEGSLSYKIQRLENQLKNSNISIQYLGSKPHHKIPYYLRQAQILILPSYWEGFPTVVLEAMVLKLPVLITPVGDLPYLVQNYKTGIFFKLTDESLRKVLDLSIENPSLLKDISREAYGFVIRNFTISIISKVILEVYKSLLNGNYFKSYEINEYSTKIYDYENFSERVIQKSLINQELL